MVRCPGADRRHWRHGCVSVFLNETKLDWWIPFFGGGDDRGWNIITAVHIEVTNTVGWISDFLFPTQRNHFG